MNFGEVIHLVTQPAGWPEPVRGIASLLSSFHCPNKPSNENFSSASSSIISEPLASHETLAPELYTAKDFQILIHSTAAGLSALAKLPHYGSKRSTVPLWAQLVHSLADTLSPDVVILEEAPFIMPRAQDVSCQPPNLIDGRATLLVAHAILPTPRTHSDRAGTNTRNKEDQDESMCSADQDELICSSDQDESIRSSDQDESIRSADQDELICYADQDESITSADSDSCDGLVDSLDLPLQALMLPGRGRCLSAVVPVLLVADPHNIIPLLCSALYQRHVWGIRHPVVGLCCSRTGTIAIAIFGWLESDHSEEGRMPRAHLAFSADFRLDPLMGVFDFTDTSSATSLAQFVLGLRTHFEDIKGATSIEAVDSLTSLHWRSDLPDFETQFWGQSDERVASWTHQVYVQMSASGTSSTSSSSSTSHTPSLLMDTVHVQKTVKKRVPTIAVDGQRVDGGQILPQDSRTTRSRGRGKQPKSSNGGSSAHSASKFAAKSDKGDPETESISNWLFERGVFSIGRITIKSKDQAKKTNINAMVDLYDDITAFAWSDEIKTILSTELSNLEATEDRSLVDIRKELCDAIGSLDCQSNETDVPSLTEDFKFISSRLVLLLHAVKGARNCHKAKLNGVNEADRRHEWDALLLNFFEPFENQRDVMFERQLNLARNLAVDNSSFVTEVSDAALEYEIICNAQYYAVLAVLKTNSNSDSDKDRVLQAKAAKDRVSRFYDAIAEHHTEDLADLIKNHSSVDPVTGKCDAILTIPFSGGATAMLQAIPSSDEQANPLKNYMLVQNPQPEKHEYQIDSAIIDNRNTLSLSKSKTLQVNSVDDPLKFTDTERILPRLAYLCDPDGKPVPQEQETSTGGTDMLLPILLAEYKKMDTTAISTAMNQMRMYLVSGVTFLSTLGITDQPVFGLVVNGTLGLVTMAWKTNDRVYVMERNVRHYDITDPLQALQFVSILRRLANYGVAFQKKLSGKQLSISDVKWSKFHQGEQDDKWRNTLDKRKTGELVPAEGGAKI